MNKMPELSDEAIKAIWKKAIRKEYGYQAIIVESLYETISKAIAKAQRELLKGWIPLPSDKRMADITAKAGGLPSPEWKTILKMLQEGDEQATI